MIAAQNGDHTFGLHTVALKRSTETRANEFPADRLVVNARKHVLQSVGKRAVPDIVKQHRTKRGLYFLRAELDLLLPAPVAHDLKGKPASSESMLEARMLGAVKSAVAHSQLADSSEALEVGVVDQLREYAVG